MESELFRVQSEGDVMVFTFLASQLSKEEDLKAVFSHLRERLDDLDVIKVVLDFKAVTFVNSSLLGQLVALKKFVDERHGALIVAQPSEDVMDTFRITRLDEYFEIHETLGAALDNLKHSIP